MQSLLQARTSHVKLAVKKLQDSFASLRSEITKALEREATEIVVGVPIYFGTESRREVHIKLEQVEFTVLAIEPFPALISSKFGFHHPGRISNQHTLLAVDFNHACLDMTNLTTSHGPNDVLAYSLHFELGEDTSNLKIAGLILDGAIGRSDHSSLKAIATQFNVRRSEPLENGADPNDTDIPPLDFSDFWAFEAENIDPSKLAGSDVVEHKHCSNIVIALEEFVTNHTNAVEPNDGSPCKPLLSEVNNIVAIRCLITFYASPEACC